jgi:hypothetical protein
MISRNVAPAPEDFVSARRPFRNPEASHNQRSMNGKIEMHGAPGSGLAFDIRLPMKKHEALAR